MILLVVFDYFIVFLWGFFPTIMILLGVFCLVACFDFSVTVARFFFRLVEPGDILVD